MADTVSVTGRIQVTIEVDWPHSFGEKATAVDIHTTVARECENVMRNALNKADVSYRIIGTVKPLMVIFPVKKP